MNILESIISTENFFKFLTLSGLLLASFAILYPTNENKKLEIQLNEYVRDSTILNNKMCQLKKEVTNLKNGKINYQSTIDSVKTKYNELGTELAMFNEKKRNIDTVNHYISVYNRFKWFAFIIGLASFIVGIIFWIKLQKLETEIKQYQRDILKKQSTDKLTE
jgi:hypothetical protein